MPTIYYSKSANGFYIEGLNPTIPADKVLVSETAWAHLIANQGSSSQIAADSEGNPVLVDPTQDGKIIWTSAGTT